MAQPKRGQIYSIDPDPSLGRELRGRHYWLVLTEEIVNRHGMVIAVAINTTATGVREAGLAVQIAAGPITGVAVINQVRSFDLRARNEQSGVRHVATAPAAIVDDIANRVASLIDPEPPSPAKRKGEKAVRTENENALGAALKAAIAKQDSAPTPQKLSAESKRPAPKRK